MDAFDNVVYASGAKHSFRSLSLQVDIGNIMKDKVYNLFEIVMVWYNKRLDMIQAKIEHH